jgi:pyrimidine operon attenuation protein/uracil phosphoribosyltransferase
MQKLCKYKLDMQLNEIRWYAGVGSARTANAVVPSVPRTPSERARGGQARYHSCFGSPILGAMAAPAKHSTVLDARAFDRTLRRMADEIVELNNGTDNLVIVGIQRRGVQLAAQIVSSIAEREKVDVPQGALDITLYRDDLQTVGPRPVVGQTKIPVDIDGMNIIIVDDVLYTGRTIRAALDELADFGRPARIALAVLIDRGGRELPIQPDIVGKTIQVGSSQRVDVMVEELDGKNAVVVADREAGT